jgi:hypothetical protein
MNTQPEKPAQKTNQLTIRGINLFAIVSIVFGIVSIIPSACGSYIWIDNMLNPVGFDYGMVVAFWILILSGCGMMLGLFGVMVGCIAIWRIKRKKDGKGIGIAIIGILLGLLSCIPIGCFFFEIIVGLFSQ